jgi:hypothetical protein
LEVKEKAVRAGDVAEVVGLPSNHETLSSSLSTTKQINKKLVGNVNVKAK